MRCYAKGFGLSNSVLLMDTAAFAYLQQISDVALHRFPTPSGFRLCAKYWKSTYSEIYGLAAICARNGVVRRKTVPYKKFFTLIIRGYFENVSVSINLMISAIEIRLQTGFSTRPRYRSRADPGKAVP